MVKFIWNEIEFQLLTRKRLVTLLPQIPNVFQKNKERFIHQNEVMRINLIKKIIEHAERPINIDHEMCFCNFIVFPEYTVPLSFIKSDLEKSIEPSIKKNSIVVFCLEHIFLEDYVWLFERYNSNYEEIKKDLESIKNDSDYESTKKVTIVNCCLIIIKDNNGTCHYHVQSKLKPSMLEEDVSIRNLYEGNHVFIFTLNLQNAELNRINLAFLICFDVIYQEGKYLQELLNQLRKKNENLDYVTVLQCNPKPDMDNIRDSIINFLRMERKKIIIIQV